MSWSYSSNDLNLTTSSGRLNTVRFLIGDTDTTDQLVQNEEITFALSILNNNVYTSAGWVCRAIAAKFSRLVDTEISAALSAKYSTRAKQYQQLATQVENQGKRLGGRSLGVSAGGISESAMYTAEVDPDRVKPAFRVGQFDNTEAGVHYLPDEPDGV
ncbi:hypothetical protein UFOVP346_52 [uncultured Caudovirales phage]|uniref:Uncharacterized protein n=1 Tax=uncultured Caudovirales phage TaxID=2100421 RepID=A0A6J5LZZ9_9CAUD|nr:hypothetical protein UFOVP346_52 [uncultured Caudovirales phage]